MKTRTYEHEKKWYTEVTVDDSSSISRDATDDEIAAAKAAGKNVSIEPTDTVKVGDKVYRTKKIDASTVVSEEVAPDTPADRDEAPAKPTKAKGKK